MNDTREKARVAHAEALDALQKWSTANEKRMQLAAQVAQAETLNTSNANIATIYQQLCDEEMLCAGWAIVAMAKAQQLTMQAYDELAPEPLLSVSHGTTEE
jgi:hypothetical protein